MTDPSQRPELPEEPHFQCEIPMRWGDMDALGHLNNTLYLRYCEEARFLWLSAAGVKMTPESYPVVITVGCTFLRPVVYPATMRLDCYAVDPGRSSFMAYFRMFTEEEPNKPCAEAHSKVVWVGADGKSRPLPDKVRAWFD
ncbi:acyl-CoA thioesterase [Marinimicrobium agarilyticum]|uniref:acyl-CoA thioesterase n=1 Tax=Marinimicrobium agarilyticum TaxID=306546 RepID=UPI00040F6FE6|nr:thioesterase family protein [Marinimicrobium agarilyticum]